MRALTAREKMGFPALTTPVGRTVTSRLRLTTLQHATPKANLNMQKLGLFNRPQRTPAKVPVINRSRWCLFAEVEEQVCFRPARIRLPATPFLHVSRFSSIGPEPRRRLSQINTSECCREANIAVIAVKPAKSTLPGGPRWGPWWRHAAPAPWRPESLRSLELQPRRRASKDRKPKHRAASPIRIAL